DQRGSSTDEDAAAESFTAATSEQTAGATGPVAEEAIAAPPAVEPTVSEPSNAPAPVEAIVVIDEFDEVFSLGPAARDEFLNAVVAAAERCRVVVTLRPETYAMCALHSQLARLVGVNSVMVTPMTADEIARAITRPAEM